MTPNVGYNKMMLILISVAITYFLLPLLFLI